MAIDVFGEKWAEAWKEALDKSDAYREAGRGWEGSIVLALENGGEAGPAAYADLKDGRCLEARAAGREEFEKADFVIAADADTWKGLLTGELDPMFAVLQGRLNLRKGKTAQLLPYAQAAKEMVRAAHEIDTRFP